MHCHGPSPPRHHGRKIRPGETCYAKETCAHAEILEDAQLPPAQPQEAAVVAVVHAQSARCASYKDRAERTTAARSRYNPQCIVRAWACLQLLSGARSMVLDGNVHKVAHGRTRLNCPVMVMLLSTFSPDGSFPQPTWAVHNAEDASWTAVVLMASHGICRPVVLFLASKLQWNAASILELASVPRWWPGLQFRPVQDGNLCSVYLKSHCPFHEWENEMNGLCKG